MKLIGGMQFLITLASGDEVGFIVGIGRSGRLRTFLVDAGCAAAKDRLDKGAWRFTPPNESASPSTDRT